MILTIDRGNTKDKLAVFDKNDIIFADTVSEFNESKVKDLLNQFSISDAVYSSVRSKDANAELENMFQHLGIKLYSAKTLLCEIEPRFQENKISNKNTFINNYSSKETLGEDRLVAVFAVWAMFEKSVLVIDAGTCITYDYLDENSIYQGGSIAPGFMIKYNALHNFTANLPLISRIDKVSLCGKTTQDCIASGVINGTLSEIENIIEKYHKENSDIKVVLTGGDAEFISKNLQHKIEYVPDLLLYGLKNILEIHAKEI
ncbi:MAG: type III pantothenate kinase [Bacteroidales bacterium]|nr:type III pantothenate kinase [Candidatus Scybalousia scybalohippi]